MRILPPPSPLVCHLGKRRVSLSPLVPPALSPPCALEADPSRPQPWAPCPLPTFCLLSSGAPGEGQGESGGRMSMPGLLVFRGASGHNPGRVALSTAPSLSLLSAPCLHLPSALGVSPYSVLGILPWVLWLPYTLHRPLDSSLFKSPTLHGPHVVFPARARPGADTCGGRQRLAR